MVTSSDPTMTDIAEKTEVIYCEENIVKDTVELIPSAKKCIDEESEYNKDVILSRSK